MDFVTMLMEVQDGDAARSVNVKLHELLDAIRNTAGKGTLTLKMTIEPSKLAMGGGVQMVSTSVEVAIKKPELGIGESLFYITEDGLSRNDPRQDEMFKYDEEKERKNG